MTTTHTPASASPHAPARVPSLGADLQASPRVRGAIASLVDEVRARSAHVVGVRGPTDTAARQSYEEAMAAAGESRGRGLLFPYLGSGLGNGALVELADGSVKWDMISGIGVHFFGHSHPALIEAALHGALGDTAMQGNLQGNTDQYEFLNTLVRLAGRKSRIAHAYLATNGVMANENALKVCYQKHAGAAPGGAPRVIAFKDCFMGRSVTMSQIGDSAAYRIGIPLSTLVDYMPFYDAAAAERMGQSRYIDMAVAVSKEEIASDVYGEVDKVKWVAYALGVGAAILAAPTSVYGRRHPSRSGRPCPP